MSAISEIYDATKTMLDTLYAPKKATPLNNPTDIEENPELVLKRAYGFYFGPGLDLGTITNQIQMERELIITLTLETGSSQHKNLKRESAEKELLEEQVLLIKQLHSDPGITEEVSGIIFKSDNGVESIFGESSNFIMIQTRFLVTYIETGV